MPRNMKRSFLFFMTAGLLRRQPFSESMQLVSSAKASISCIFGKIPYARTRTRTHLSIHSVMTHNHPLLRDSSLRLPLLIMFYPFTHGDDTKSRKHRENNKNHQQGVYNQIAGRTPQKPSDINDQGTAAVCQREKGDRHKHLNAEQKQHTSAQHRSSRSNIANGKKRVLEQPSVKRRLQRVWAEFYL